ncbi:uncharacterized protein A1O5_04647 [Cladophialophora psammophila CBS 110553]|uniref:SAP domain-containing protein n=1 Tax=Cladophialophora psammophila CBS 110553 TaxID=1182543 RepID=W9WW11_9EURO|nr:uncharacterized protein A1O5_04647 [Cladophialophora psammophila CBS 110553]EXJ72143.1 hypothetical protein A1O5_04647 [Cladophialophora psammophila CBS 110553]
MVAADLLEPQPDTARMVQCFHGVAEELSKLPNASALAQGNAIQHALAQLTVQITRLDQKMVRMDQRFDQLDNKIDTLTTRVIAKDVFEYNSSARVQNSYLTRPTDRLTPRMSPLTNALIEDFPARSRDIPNIEGQRLVSILQELGLPTNGGREAREKRLGQHIALQPTPTTA